MRNAPEYTAAVNRALDAAAVWAQRAGADVVQPLHILLGLLDEDEGRAATLLIRAGLDLAAVRQALAEPKPVSAAAAPQPPSLSPQSQQVLHQARDFLGALILDETVSSEQVLLALLHGDDLLRGQLETLGLAWEQLRQTTGGISLHVEDPLPIDEPLRLGETTERMDAARLLDANFNRAREALRIVEDYCRFVLDDAFLSGELKRLRHDLVEALLQHDPDHSWDLAARETLRDVGTRLTAPREHERTSLLAVVQTNLKRAQEALRSLEEFGKLHGPGLGRALEQLRYRCYTLERAIILGAGARQRLEEARLYLLVTGALCRASLEWTIQEAAAGGVQIVQLREKQLADRALLERAREIRHCTRQLGVLFIMNDRADIARLVEADGIHVGQDELPVKEARRLLGPQALIGVSTHDLEQVRLAVLDGASYIGVGPTFPSRTKDFSAFPGLDFIRQAAAETSLPAFAIGGITLTNLPDAVAAGARRVAVSQSICQVEDPRRAAREMRELLE